MDEQRADAKLIITMMTDRIRERGLLTPYERTTLDRAYDALEAAGQKVTWQAYVGENLMGEGSTYEDAFEDAIRNYEKDFGYATSSEHSFTDRYELGMAIMLALKVGVPELKQEIREPALELER